MTGYNHYPDCSCGWCINQGWTRINRAELKASYRLHEAESFLQKHGARSIAGCYVNPNARCPVCGAAVFFYANASGSRVYFDDLGPPWQKHPCTNNPRKPIAEHPAFTSGPVRRAAGITQELVEAARTAGAFHASLDKGGRWHLLVVVALERRGKSNKLLTEHLATDDAQRMWISCVSDEPIFEVGDFLSRQGKQFSFFHRGAMSPAGFALGGPVMIHLVEKTAATQPAPQPPIAKLKLAPTSKIPVKPTRIYDMTKKEMAHFHAKHRTVQQLCDDLLPTVRAYAKDGFRKPRQVSEMLNRDGHRTLLGAEWTPRLTYFLLGLMFLPEQKSTNQMSKETSTAARPHEGDLGKSTAMTTESIAERLSHLGRVVIAD